MKNGKPIDLEKRLARLEADVKEIKAMLHEQRPEQAWWKPFVGMFENDPAAAEVDQIVRENREQERRKARRGRAKTKAKA